MKDTMIDSKTILPLVEKYKTDPESLYNTWFINNQVRLKAFGAIRRGVEQVIADIKAGTFPSDFKGSSLETVLNAITEQKEIFEGAAHAFFWKPKLRIPDIYENGQNKILFGQFLEACLQTNKEDRILKEIMKLSGYGIKGLGPAVANILYFIHPLVIPPSNTAMLRGFNTLFRENKKLGSWDDYLEMRSILIEANQQMRNVLSNDLGAISGLLFDVGSGRMIVDGTSDSVIDQAQEKREKILKKRHLDVRSELEEEDTHTKIQYLLLRIGKSLNYDVVVAANDRLKSYANEYFSFLSLPELPKMDMPEGVLRTVSLIDVMWLEKGTNKIVCAFEVEKTTSIYSGILRLTDLACTLSEAHHEHLMLYLVAPPQREKDIIAQLRRPSLSAGNGIKISYILFPDLCEHCDSICKLGEDSSIMRKIAKVL